ncbi:hypothetical protein CBER1_05661 [Cercospora berteroae]|uniref:Uncharacterized protein n=1 Tax=Cercospora berteroae TaxID=357750 RepID=A0A2S6C5H7_9PEZI|nr:hypothetical protein CBER1_05661 [Cercospora berteroae]
MTSSCSLYEPRHSTEERSIAYAWNASMKLDEATAKSDNLEFLFDQLRTRSDEESSMILAIIRLGADLEKVVSQLKEAPQQVFSKDNALNIDHFMTDSGDAGAQEEATPTPHISPEQSTISGVARGRIP